MPATIQPIAVLIETKNASTITLGNVFQIFVPFPPCFLFPPFCPPLSPTTPITPYNPPNIFRAPPFPPRVFSASAGVICASARVDGAGRATIVQKWINNSYTKLKTGSFSLQPSISKSYTVSQQSRPQVRTGVRFWLVDGLRLFHMENWFHFVVCWICTNVALIIHSRMLWIE